MIQYSNEHNNYYRITQLKDYFFSPFQRTKICIIIVYNYYGT